MIPERNPKGRVAGKGGRGPKFKEAFTIRFWQPYHYNTCYRSSGRSRMFKLRLGLGFQTYARIPLLGALWARVGLDCFVSSSSYSSSSASSSSSLCLRLHPPRYALSLSLTTTSRFSRADPRSSTSLALCSLTSEVERDHVHSKLDGRQQPKWVQV